MDTEEKLREKVLGAMSGTPKSPSSPGMVPVSDTNNQPVGKSMFDDGSHRRTEKYQDANGNSIVKTYERKGGGLAVPHGFSALDYGNTEQPKGGSGVAPLMSDAQKEEKYIKSLGPDQLKARDRYQEDYVTGPFAKSNRAARSEAESAVSFNDRRIGLAKEWIAAGGSLGDFDKMAGTNFGGGRSDTYDNSGQINARRANLDYWDRQANNIVGNPRYTASAARAALGGLSNAREAMSAEQGYETQKTNAGTGIFNAQTGRLSSEAAIKLGLDKLGLSEQEMLLNKSIADRKQSLAENMFDYEQNKPMAITGYIGNEHASGVYRPKTGLEVLMQGAIPKADNRTEAALLSAKGTAINNALKIGEISGSEAQEKLAKLGRGESLERKIFPGGYAIFEQAVLERNPKAKPNEIKKLFNRTWREE